MIKEMVTRYFIFRPLVWFKLIKDFEKLRRTPRKTENEYIQQQRCVEWFRIKGDETLRLDYALSPSSVVFDVGGFHGEFASMIYNKYGCKMYIFEPLPEFCRIIRNKFSPNPDVKVFCFGLSDRTIKESISSSGDTSSIYLSGNKVEIELKSAVDFIRENKIENIDLMKINIEGGEYDLLTDLINNKLINRISNIQVQFHDFIIDNAREKMQSIQNELAITHEVTYQYEFVWENWKLKNDAISQ
jgi:FkbM family methyltransferase